MSKQLTVDDFQQSLNAHFANKGEEIREKYGRHIGWNQLLKIPGRPELHSLSLQNYFRRHPTG